MSRLRAVAREHPRHAVLAALVAGLLVGGWVPAAALAAAAFGAALVLHLTGRAFVSALAAVVLAGGATAAEARRAAIDRGPLPAAIGAALEADLVLLEPAHRRASGDIVARARLTAGPARDEVLLVKAREPAAAALLGAPVGRMLRLGGRLAPLRPFDELQRRRGALAAFSVRTAADTGRGRGGLAGRLDGIRERARAGMAAGLAPAEQALAHGMVLGDDAAIADDVRESFRRSGLAHLLAASGTNVMLLATLVIGIGALLGTRLRLRLALALVLVAAYVPLAGGGPSIQRAGVMGAAGLIAALAGRPASRWYAIGLAAAVSLALNPYSAADPGWQLSFAAVVGLALLGPPVGRALARTRLPAGLTEAAAMTIAATLTTAPLLALHFETVSVASLPANVLAAPAVAPLMWLGTIAGAVGQAAAGLATPINVVNAHLLGYVGWLADACARLPGAAVPIHLSGPLAAVAAYAAIAVAALAVKRARRRHRTPAGTRAESRGPGPRGFGPSSAGGAAALALGAVALALLLVGPPFGRHQAPPPPRPGETVVTFLDVGQGDATLVQRDGASILIDAGPPDGRVVERLRQAGVRRLDAVMVTHAQLDHEGGMPAVVERYRPRLVIDGGAGWPTRTQRALAAYVRARRPRLVVPEAGQRLRIGRLELRILWPPRGLMRAPPQGDPNQRAVVAHLRSGDFDLFLPADAESEVQAGLTLPAVEALKVAHHGSSDAGLPGLLARLRPRVAAIEVGRANTYGHPTPSTLAALQEVPHVYRTDRDGTVRLTVHGDTLSVRTSGGSLRR